ncbi:alpha/beta fold hydrolase [Pseudonocardia cypriaca]|uniref:Haloacetate dehalogenase n=1 Tax=Pseudonocardia cypriaca TaxID=882449 RepID=A0A543FN81_9PSEU|nr:alpha/beta hydrolase [Pseudonocardia cypriaca]TQM35328.1 haloacetate dehalogenase [Pseudonocardia cypriaca]
MPWAGFEDSRVRVGEAEYAVTCGGQGPPLLLLHGFPQTHACWSRVAPALARQHTVVAPDLRGYGASRAPAGGPQGEGYTKREMARELVELMGRLGHRRFAVVGHDRGARVAYRMGLDHPEQVERVAVLNVVPTLDQFARMGGGPSLGYWPWFLLAQPEPFPERLVGADPAALLDHAFDTWTSRPDAIDPQHRAEYLAAATPDTIAAMCGDYRASFHLDRAHDAADGEAGRKIVAPLLVVTGADETQLADAPDVWAAWADDLTTASVPGGHFVPEEAPEELLAVLEPFLGPL